MNFCVVGAGAWGTAFAVYLARSGHGVSLVPRRTAQSTEVRRSRENSDYLPGVKLPDQIDVTDNLAAAMEDSAVVLLACPSQALRETCMRIRSALPGAGAPDFVVSLAKGLELATHLRPSQVISATLPGIGFAALTGPTNAAQFARGLPAAMVLGYEGPPLGAVELQGEMSSPTLRIYTSDDLTGVEYGGCLKNIYAIAAGCSDGLKLGDNAKAALLTRALAEMVRVGVSLGARTETFYGLSGFGDLVATCHGGWSRNRQFGEQIGKGQDAATLVANRRTVVEGYRTTESFAGLCEERKIDAPILREVYAILFEGKKPADALATLMSRELKSESVMPFTKSS